MLDLEGGGDLRLAAIEPQHVDEPDGVGTRSLLDGPRQPPEAAFAELAAVVGPAAVIRRDPDVVAERPAEVAQAALDLRVRAVVLALRGGRPGRLGIVLARRGGITAAADV